jgi:hypothetical protein
MTPVEDLSTDAVLVSPVNIDFLGNDRGSWGLPAPNFHECNYEQCDDYLKTFGYSLRLTLLSQSSSEDLKKLALSHGADKTLLDRLTRDGLLGYVAGMTTDEKLKTSEAWRGKALELLEQIRRALIPSDDLAFRIPGIESKQQAIIAVRDLMLSELPVTLIELMDGHFYLVLCRNASDRHLALAQAFITLGHLPPVTCCDFRLEDNNIHPRLLSSCLRTCQILKDYSITHLRRLTAYQGR